MFRANEKLWTIAGLLVICCRIVTSDWEFAVATDNRIIFYDSDWQTLHSFVHDNFDSIYAIAHDDSSDTIFFNDKVHQNGSIFSLRLNDEIQKTSHFDRLVHKSSDEQIVGIAFDSLERSLYWTDANSQKVFRMPLGNSSELMPGNVSVWRVFDGYAKPHGIAIDVCRRKIYLSVVDGDRSKIYSTSMDGSDEKIIIEGDMITGLTVDQYTKRLYWVDDLHGIDYTVGSSKLDGNDKEVVVKGMLKDPHNLAVDHTFIYWIDSTSDTLWKVPKIGNNSKPEEIKLAFKTKPHGIIFRHNLIPSTETNADCKAVFERMNAIIYDKSTTTAASPVEVPSNVQCTPITIPNLTCHNYCLRGSCHEQNGIAKCQCPDGYTGDRCEQDACFAYCLNGKCLFDTNTLPICKTKICDLFCASSEQKGSHELINLCGCGSYENNTTTLVSETDALTASPTCINYTITIVCAAAVLSLVLVFMIVTGIRHCYKPIRPRIKKTFVVRNKMDQKRNRTPLTCRPATEQCEITIEDCCNMNICDTPCFDPETMHEEIKKERSRKEDKYNLLSNVDGDLY